jgi:Bacterial capsule synthesis protein PGA_cap
VPDHVTRDCADTYIDQGEGGAYLKSLRLKSSNDGSTGESLSYPLLDRPFAYHLIDAGADVILGHHPPHRKGIEVDRGKVVINASSNVLRGHNGPHLDGRHLARSTLGPKSVDNVEVLPIIGKGQPEWHTWTRVNEGASSAQFCP